MMILLSIPILVHSQTYLWEEDFDVDPGTWTLQDNWSIQGGMLQFYFSPTIENYNLSATSPIINLPANAGNLFIEQHINYYSFVNESFEVAVLVGGETNVLWTHTNGTNWGNYGGGSVLELSLIPYQNQNIQLRFRSWGSSTWNINYWQIYHLAIEGSFDNDLAAISISGNSTPSVGIPSDYTVRVRNTGVNAQTNYTVKLMRQGDVELVSIPGTPINSGQNIDFVLTWTPAQSGPTFIYGEVVLTGDEVPDNNTTPSMNINVQGEGVVAVTIGTDTTTIVYLPFNFYYRNSLSQTIYMNSEFGNTAGIITGLTYYNNFVTNLPNMPIKIWMAETTNTDLSGGWIPANQMTMVFDGNVDFLSGQNDIIIPLQIPFVYEGNNLVVMAQRPMDTVYYSFSDHFYYTTTPQFANRTRYAYSDGETYDPNNPPLGTLDNKVPNTTFYLDTSGMGSLDGFVYDINAQPLSGVSIVVVGTYLNTVTNASGYFSFPYVSVGTYDVEASKFGYHTSLMEDVEIEEDETTSINFTLTQLANVTVSGQVVGSDFPTIGLENALVNLTGYDDYNTITGVNGFFSIPGVYSNHTYNLMVAVEGYSNYIGTAEVGNVDLDLGIIIVDELAFPPRNVIATQSPDDTYVDLEWNMPGTAMGTEQWIYWGPGTNPDNNGIGTGGAVIFSVAHRFTPDNLLDLDVAGLSITAIKFWPRESVATYTVKVWCGGSSNPWNAGTEVHSQPTTNLVYGNWNEVILNTPVYIDPTQEIWIGYEVNTPTGWPAGCDPGPHVNGFGNLILWNDVWSPLIDLNPALTYNWCVQGYAGIARGDKAILLTTHETDNDLTQSMDTISLHHRNERVMEGFVVYRFLHADIGDEDLWTELTTLTDTTYVDFAWNNVPSGFYRYAVKAEYTNEVLSNPAFSNWVGKDMTTNVTINITTDVGDSAAGATVSLYYQDQDPDGNSPIYNQTATGDDPATTTFFNVLRGNYNLQVSKPGYTTYTQTNINIQVITEIDVVLNEIPYPPANLIYTAGNNLVNLSWQAPIPPNRDNIFELSSFLDSDDYLYQRLRDSGILNKEELAREFNASLNKAENHHSGRKQSTIQRESRALLGYNVYRDGVQINTELVPNTGYVDNTVENNVTYVYYVTAVYTLAESVPSNSVTVVPGPNQLIQIGDGTTSGYYLPFNFWYMCSLTQTIYMADELNIAGLITQIRYYNNFVTNLANMPVQIWIGETNQDNLSTDWIPSTELELVFSGNVNFPSGQNEIVIELDEFFFYTGSGNLVVMAKRNMDTTYYSSMDHFYYTTTPQYPNRSRYLFSDVTDYDHTNPTGGTLSNNVPNTGIYFVTVGMGSMDGYIYNQDNQPLAGSMITVADTDFVAYTNAQGYYLFPYMFEGTHTVTASHFGYYDGVAENVLIIEYENTSVNFTLNPLPSVTLSGRVVGSDQPDVGLDNAFISLDGYNYYETNSNTQGLFTIPGVYADHTYTMTVQRGGYSNLTQQVEVGNTDLDLGDVIVNELAFPPFDVTADISLDGMSANIEWVSPDAYDFIDFRYDDGVPALAIGFPSGTSNSIMGAVHRRSAILNSVSWYLGGATNHPTVNLFIFGLNAQGLPNSNLVLYQANNVANNHQQWTIYELPNDISAPNGFLIGLSVTGNLGLAADDGVGAPYVYQNNTHYFTENYTTGTWMTMESAGYSNNFLLRAQGFDLGPIRDLEPISGARELSYPTNLHAESIELFDSQSSPLIRNSKPIHNQDRVLVGFIIYRLQPGQEQNPNSWTEIGTVPVSTTEFTDTGLPDLLNGSYRYAVRSVYTNNVLSDAALSNTINYVEQIPYISNLDADVQGNDVYLTWQWVSRSDRLRHNSLRQTGDEDSSSDFRDRAFLGFKITRNGPVIAEGIMDLSYLDEDLPAGNYTYTIIGQFTNGTTNMLYIQVTVATGLSDELILEPLVTALLGNHPNPFNPDTTIQYSLASNARVLIEVYNIRGQHVKTLVDNYQTSGRYKVTWNGQDERGRDAGSGIFFYRMKTGEFTSTRKMIMLK